MTHYRRSWYERDCFFGASMNTNVGFVAAAELSLVDLLDRGDTDHGPSTRPASGVTCDAVDSTYGACSNIRRLPDGACTPQGEERLSLVAPETRNDVAARREAPSWVAAGREERHGVPAGREASPRGAAKTPP